jgi:hypothetical protein
MAVITTGRKPKPFSWSYSKLKNFAACPKKHFSVDLAKLYKEPDSEALMWGDRVHKGLASAIQNRLAKRQGLIPDIAPMPTGLEPYEKILDRIMLGDGDIFVEEKLAINKDFQSVTFFADDAWFRGIGDVIKINDNVGFVGDWKTGKLVEDSVQLALSAACLFARWPQLEAVRSEFFWLKEGPDCSSREDFLRSDMPNLWRGLWPRIEELRIAHETTTYPPKPGGLCVKYCPVADCAYHGRGSR